MDTRILPASEANGLPRGPLHGPKGYRPLVYPEGRRVTSHESPVTSCKPFRFILLSKNAPANHLESHSCKNKGLKVSCFHTLTKNIGGRGVPTSQPGLSPLTGHQRRGPSARIVPRMSSEALISVRDLAKHFRTFKR